MTGPDLMQVLHMGFDRMKNKNSTKNVAQNNNNNKSNNYTKLLNGRTT